MWLLLISTIGLVLLFGFLLFSLASLVIATLTGAPYVPARKDRIATLVKYMQPLKNKRIVDLGSGDGRVVRELALQGAIVDGYEIQWLLILWSRLVSRIKGINTTRYFRRNLYSASLAEYDAVVLYALPNMMEKLRCKFELELRPGAEVVSIAFPIPGWQEVKRQNEVYLYLIERKL